MGASEPITMNVETRWSLCRSYMAQSQLCDRRHFFDLPANERIISFKLGQNYSVLRAIIGTPMYTSVTEDADYEQLGVAGHRRTL